MKKINLKGISEILSEKELKNVMGGSTNAKCQARCRGGNYVSISCSGTCTASDGIGASCTQDGKVSTVKCS